MTGYCPAGLPHSEIPGSKPVCGSPRLIAAYRVLRRLSAPRHPPCTLSSLTKLEHSFPGESYRFLPDSVVNEHENLDLWDPRFLHTIEPINRTTEPRMPETSSIHKEL